MTTQQDLSAAIAASGSEWQQPGVRVFTNDGGEWRVVVRQETSVYIVPDDPMSMATAGWYSGLRAMEPDLSDDATIGVLLGLMPDARIELWDNMWTGRMWTCWPQPLKNGFSGNTRAEAIARAYLAIKGAM